MPVAMIVTRLRVGGIKRRPGGRLQPWPRRTFAWLPTGGWRPMPAGPPVPPLPPHPQGVAARVTGLERNPVWFCRPFEQAGRHKPSSRRSKTSLSSPVVKQRTSTPNLAASSRIPGSSRFKSAVAMTDKHCRARPFSSSVDAKRSSSSEAGTPFAAPHPCHQAVRSKNQDR